MNDRASLLKAVCAAPADDLPRLVYADWLDDHGGNAGAARAALIRVQIELWKRDPGRQTGCGLVDPKDPNYGSPLVEQEKALAEQISTRAFDGLDPKHLLEARDIFGMYRLEAWGASPSWFERGFVTHVSGAGVLLTRQALPWLCQREPVRTVEVRGCAPREGGLDGATEWVFFGRPPNTSLLRDALGRWAGQAALPTALLPVMLGLGRHCYHLVDDFTSPHEVVRLGYSSHEAALASLSDTLLAEAWKSCSEVLPLSTS